MTQLFDVPYNIGFSVSQFSGFDLTEFDLTIFSQLKLIF